ncbi:MAG TPA: LLM class F420-dependent oxidoreductase [Candidatus Binataceae bacterium]|jgi:probable F420-dependent oxidoreductase|nr:LLM class F420-dependent oxidoreductase [Candidatus Binataceae bacterium]
MKIGVLAFVASYTADPAALAQHCESLGFESFYLPEHPILPVKHKTRYPLSPDGEIPEPYAHMIDPFVGLTLAAAATRRIGLGTGICLVPERSPLILAKVIATLDHYSGGRFIFGIGAGWLRDESEIMGVDFKRRWAITREYVLAMKELWTKPEASFAGEFVKFPPVKSNPKPARKPHPPVHIGAGGIGPSMDRALRDTVAIGDGWAPLGVPPEQLITELAKLKKLCAEAGRDFGKLEITMYAPVMQGGDPKRTIAAYQEAGAHRLILFPEKLGPNEYQRDLETIAKAWVA